jgi:glycosyltransferase involved in cell wall biosynthesis
MSLDIVIPAHDEERRIDRTLWAYRSWFTHADVRFIVALDGCRDRTADVVAAHTAADPRVECHEFPKLGKGGVLMEAFRRCDADLVGFVDADCATPPSEMARLTGEVGETDGVIANRWHPAAFTPVPRRGARRMTSAGFAWLIRRLFALPFADTQCGAKVLRRSLVERAIPLMSSRDFLFDVDLLIVARRLGFAVNEVPTIWIDQADSRLSAGRDSIRMLTSSLRLWLHHRVLPIHNEPVPVAAPAVAVTTREEPVHAA